MSACWFAVDIGRHWCRDLASVELSERDVSCVSREMCVFITVYQGECEAFCDRGVL